MKNTLLSLLISLTLLSPSLSASEWTDFPLAAGAREVYVSSSEGNDANDGLTPATPKRTITGTPAPTPTNPNNVLPGGFSAVRNGMGDHLLLKRGDTFSEPLSVVWNRSGLSAAYPAVFSAYGTGPRPVIDRGGAYGMHISPVTGPTVRYVAVTGIHFRAARRDWSSPEFGDFPGQPAIFIAAGMNAVFPIVEDVLIEDCKIEFHGAGISMVGAQLNAIRNVRLNRNVLSDIYVRNAFTTAVYASNVTGLTLTENLIDGVQRTAMAAGVPNVLDSAFCHSVYVQSDSRDVVLEQNIIANAFDGGMMRPGGRYAGNVVLQTSIGSHHGYMSSVSAPIITEGVEANIVNNAFLGPFQYGIQIGNLRYGFAIGNVMLSSGRLNSTAFNLIGRTDQDTAPYAQVGVNNLTIFNNYVLGTAALTAAGPVISNVTVNQNQFRNVTFNPNETSPPPAARLINHIDYEAGDFDYSNNRYHSEAPPNLWFRVQTTNYTLPGWTAFMGEEGAAEVTAIDPSTVPSVAGYHAFIGGAATETAFLAAARQQSRQSWDQRYMAAPVFIYLRRSLGLM